MTTSTGTEERSRALSSDEGACPTDVDAPGDAKYVEHVPIDGKGKGRTVSVTHIDYILAVGCYVELHVGDRRFIVREALHVLERRLDPRAFMRIHQSSIVRLERVNRFVLADSGDHEIQLTNGTRLGVSRSRRDALQGRLAAAG